MKIYRRQRIYKAHYHTIPHHYRTWCWAGGPAGVDAWPFLQIMAFFLQAPKSAGTGLALRRSATPSVLGGSHIDLRLALSIFSRLMERWCWVGPGCCQRAADFQRGCEVCMSWVLSLSAIGQDGCPARQ